MTLTAFWLARRVVTFARSTGERVGVRAGNGNDEWIQARGEFDDFVHMLFPFYFSIKPLVTRGFLPGRRPNFPLPKVTGLWMMATRVLVEGKLTVARWGAGADPRPAAAPSNWVI
jgi:hypothetical protein